MTDNAQHRRQRLLEILSSKRGYTRGQLAQQFDCSTKSIQRDIEYLRQHGEKIDAGKDGYRLLGSSRSRQSSQNSAVIATLLLATASFDRRFSQFHEKMSTALKKHLLALSTVSNFEWYLENHATDAESIPLNDRELKNFGELAKAIMSPHSVTIHYTALGYDQGVDHDVFPVQLKERDGIWYLLAFDHRKKERRVFALTRIGAISTSEVSYPIPDATTVKSIQNHGNFSIWDDPTKEQQTIKLRLFGYAAWYIRERKIHESQKYRIINKDEVELTLKTGDLLGVKLWLRKFIPNVEILEPLSFREEFKQDLVATLQRF